MPAPRRRIFSVALLGFCLLALGCQPAAKQAGPFFWGFALENERPMTQMIQAVHDDTGLRPQIVAFFLQWPATPEERCFPGESLEAIWQAGAIPVLTWEPMFYQQGQEIMVPAKDILAGAYDGYVEAFAKEAKAWGRPFIIRFAHEMNLARYHWGTEKKDYGPASPELYRRMFRHVVSVFKRAGADNVLWAFCPNAESLPNTSTDRSASWNKARSYYPGDDVVDILGMDGYNWGATQTKDRDGWKSKWRKFKNIFRPMFKELRGLSGDKPVFVFEMASAWEGGDKGRWIRDALKTMRRWQVRGAVWFQVDKELDWRLNTGCDPSRLPIKNNLSPDPQGWLAGLAGSP